VSDIENLRLHFRGVQGSGSIFPAKAECMESQGFSDINLLTQIFEDMRNNTGADNKLNSSVEDIIGGPINKETLASYKNKIFARRSSRLRRLDDFFHIETSGG
jgi:hypothetical protein